MRYRKWCCWCQKWTHFLFNRW